MKAIRRPDQYLRLRGDIPHYVRRVPKAVSHIDDRTLIYRSLDTDSRKVARQRRDICADAAEQRWHEIVPSRFRFTPREVSFRDVSQHARSLGFNYEPMDSLISRDTVTDLLHRLQALGPLKDAPQPKEEHDADALLGVAKTPSVTISEAMELYLSEIVADELAGKSPEQVKNFSKIKRRAVANFVNINGDIDMRDITREHAHAVRKFWHERIHPKDSSKPMSGSSGNEGSSVYRLLKAHDLISSPAFIVMKAASEFRDKTTAINQLRQTDFTYFKIMGWGWMCLSTVLDDFSRYIISWKLCTTMKTSEVTDTLNMALQASGCDQVNVVHKPRLLSDNGASYISGELADYIKDNGMSHVRGAPYHPQTQGKIERWHQTLKNRILLENYFLPGDLERQIERFVGD